MFGLSLFILIRWSIKFITPTITVHTRVNKTKQYNIQYAGVDMLNTKYN